MADRVPTHRGVANPSITQTARPNNDHQSLWSPQSPIRHSFVIKAKEQTQFDSIALRIIEARGKQILLNGQPIFLKGIALHEEALGATASRTVSEAQGRALLEQAKALDCNFVRLAHYPHAAHMKRLCDELGLMVWAEIPVYWEDVNYGAPKVLALAKTMIEELIVRDRNRGSVIMWSVANETPQTDVRTHFLTQVIAHVRSLDAIRLVTAALDKNVDIGGVADGESRLTVRNKLGEHSM